MSLLDRHRPKRADAPVAAPRLAAAPAVISQAEHQTAIYTLKKDHLSELEKARSAAAPVVDVGSAAFAEAVAQAAGAALEAATEAIEKAAAEKAEVQAKLDDAAKVLAERDEQLKAATEAIEKAAAEKAPTKKPETKPSK